jgi:hypothetical protein
MEEVDGVIFGPIVVGIGKVHSGADWDLFLRVTCSPKTGPGIMRVLEGREEYVLLRILNPRNHHRFDPHQSRPF